MARWFTKLMQKDHAGSRRAITGTARSSQSSARRNAPARDARYDGVVRMLRERDAEDRVAREKRKGWYRQHVQGDAVVGSGASGVGAPMRLHRLRTKVPCRATPEARALLDALRKRHPGHTVTFAHVSGNRQAVMLVAGAGAQPKQIGWVEHCVQTDPKLCNVRHQGLTVETDADGMLVLRFRYPATAVRVSGGRDPEEGALARRGDAVARVDFAEIRPALEPPPNDRGAAPRLVWVTRPEVETINALRSREYEAFYLRFKLEVLAGIWSSLTALLASSPASVSHRGAYYTLVREPDATNRRIHQRTVDDSGRVVDIGSDRTYDAAAATDILLLYLEGDVLADFADICFTIQSLGSAAAWFLKEEFFSIIRRYWAASQSLSSRFGSDFAAVVRMSQRALPMPAQVPLLKQEWINLRQALVDRYGEGGRKAADLVVRDVNRPRGGATAWPFATVPAGEVNVGLRVVYRQEWRHLGVQRGEVLRTTPSVARQRERAPLGAADPQGVETAVVQGDARRTLHEIVDEAIRATIGAMKWPRDRDGSVNTGVRDLAARTDMGLEAECRESSRETTARVSDVVQRMACEIDRRARTAATADGEEEADAPSTVDGDDSADNDAATYVHSRLQNRYEVLTRPAEIQNVVLVAEKLPTPAEIDLSWVRRHDWILAKVLLDESFRDALDTIRQDAGSRDPAVRGRVPAEGQGEVEAKRERLYEHVRANVLHYQRAIWQEEDPQQRSMRYRKSGRKVPLDWRFELESAGTLTIDELGARLTTASVDGQFAAYSGGREMDLDRLIDPAGPIAYYGNCAVYRMRPELGSAELFSMLHFFKSPYLRPNPVTGEPEVDDPAQIAMDDDPAVLAASDQLLEQHRDEMFDVVPKLRLELARARTRVNDGSDPGAVERLQRRPALLRAHFATFLFRRERARRFALDTDGLIVDVIRAAEPASAKNDGEAAVRETGAAPEHGELVLERESGLAVVGASGHRNADADWEILPNDDDRSPGLYAGLAHDPGAEPLVVARTEGEPTLMVASGASGLQPYEETILARSDDARSSSVHTGYPQGEDQVIVARDEDELKLSARSGDRPSGTEERAIVEGEEAERTPSVRAGRMRDAEALSFAAPDEQPGLAAMAGTGAVQPNERAIVVEGGEARGSGLFVGQADRAVGEPAILAREDGEPMSTLVAGRAHDPEAPRLALVRDDGEPRHASGTGGGAGHARERAILAEVDEERVPKLLAGAGVGRAHERMILARDDDEWLRPCLIAG